MAASVYIIGAGPGDPGLITVKGRNILREADIILHDYLVSDQILACSKENAVKISCEELGGKEGPSRQEEIHRLLIDYGCSGKKVVRLKNGDPSIFGRSSEEAAALIQAKVSFEIIPGVTAASAASSVSGIPLTDRDAASSCILITGRESSGKKMVGVNWSSAAQAGTAVFYMTVMTIGNIVGKLISAGLDSKTPAAIIQDVSLPTQRTVMGVLDTIEEQMQDASVAPPALLIVGKVVDKGRLFMERQKGKSILFTGLSKERYFLDDNYLHLPMIRIDPLEDYGVFDKLLITIDRYDWIVFASRFGVKYFMERLCAAGLDARNLSGIKLAAVGASTGNMLEKYVLSPDLVPDDESSMGLIEALKEEGITGQKIFMPRSDLSDKGLKTAFESLGAVVVSADAYKNVMPENLPDLDLSVFDEVVFTSPSSVRNFKKRYGNVPEKTSVTCIGAVTLKEAKKCQFID